MEYPFKYFIVKIVIRPSKGGVENGENPHHDLHPKYLKESPIQTARSRNHPNSESSTLASDPHGKSSKLHTNAM
jgi:hypothetical protein